MEGENSLFEIIIGTYDKLLLGFYVQLQSEKFSLKPSFVTEPHLQSVRCLASNGKILASGSTDETIQLFNIKSRREIGSLVHHNGTVTALEFYDTFLMSCSEDKNICIWATNNWECMKTLSGHKKSINDISIHPSGKMALSVSKDKTLRTWNLIKGRSAFVINLKKEADLVKWAPDGLFFIVAYDTTIDVYSVENGSVVHTMEFQHRISDLTFIADNICAVVGDNENVFFFDITSNSLCYQFKAHKTRIKAIKSVAVTDELFLITVSSDGQIIVWHLDEHDSKYKQRKVCGVKTDYRPICMTAISLES